MLLLAAYWQPGAAAPNCGPAARRGLPIRVVTTMGVLADMIERVGGERVVAENIIPIRCRPRGYQPAGRCPEDRRRHGRVL
ncbi:MAG: hypothetical protein U0Z44_10360 [Kouleothrix sp.]